jgi:hypothetical protein
MLNADRISYADFLGYGEEHDGKFEFVNGQIIAKAKPTKRHQRLAIALGNLVASHVQPRGCDALPGMTLAPSDTSDDERAPDLL